MPYKNLCYISSLALTATVYVVVVVPSVAVELSHTCVCILFVLRAVVAATALLCAAPCSARHCVRLKSA